jgi:hypothetical protein
LTPLPDGSLLVYKANPNHPLGLVPGDIVLGYGGVPWNQLYPELLAAQLPLTGWWWGSSESSWTHSMLMSAGLNWHLFDTIDVVKHATGETVHLSVAPLGSTPQGLLDCTEQLPIPGVPIARLPGEQRYGELGHRPRHPGRLRLRARLGARRGDQFQAAVSSLLTQYQTKGLIFDFRTNYGGNMFLSYPRCPCCSRRCLDDRVSRCAAMRRSPLRCVPRESGNYIIHGTAAADYDRPIAVLVGPGALSSGDQVAHLFKFHPRARFFGKSTATAFNSPTTLYLPISGGPHAMPRRRVPPHRSDGLSDPRRAPRGRGGMAHAR